MVSRPSHHHQPRIRRRRQNDNRADEVAPPYHLEEEKKECEPYDEERDDMMDTTTLNGSQYRLRRPIQVPNRRSADAAASREVDVATNLAQDALRMAIEARQAAERLRLFQSNLPAYRAAVLERASAAAAAAANNNSNP